MNAGKSTTAVALGFALVIGNAWTGTAKAQSGRDNAAHHPATTPAQTAPATAPSPGAPMQPGAMMQAMREHMAGQAMGGMMAMDHIEGRIAFLKAELAITDAQQPQWSAFADVLRAQAEKMRAMHTQMMQGGMPEAFPDRLAMMERGLSARLDALKAMEAPARALYAVLSPDQQKKANDLLAHPMGGPMGRM